MTIYLVDGNYVRDNLDIEFCLGGNYGRYPKFIAPNEIWVEQTTDPTDLSENVAHELYEYQAMKGGLNYDQAHARASAFEKALRLIHEGKFHA